MRYKIVGEIFEVVTDYVANGSFKSLKDNVNYVENGYAALIRLVDYRNNFKNSLQYIDKKSYDFLSKTKLYGGEIVISNVGANAGTIFRVPKLGIPMSLGPNTITINTSEKITNDYYYYYFQSHNGQNLIHSIISGSAQPKFNKTDFKNLSVPYPSIKEQKETVDILNALDKKIELNSKINTNLLELLDAEFTNQFINSDLPIGKVNDFVSIKRGSSPRPIKNFLSDKGRAWIKISDVTKLTSPFLYDTVQSIKESGIDKSRTIKPGTLILSNSATPGIPIISEILASVHDGWLIVDHYTHMDRNWFYLFFRQMQRQLIARANGSVFNNLKTDIVKDFPVPIAKEEELLKFKRISNPIFDKLDKLQQENIVLSKLKDILLKQYF